jgi:transcriptional regulator of acetoin/glycerol metabolism
MTLEMRLECAQNPTSTTEGAAALRRGSADPLPAAIIAIDHGQLLPLDRVCKIYILGILDHCGGDVERATRILGISRATLYRRLRL